MAATRRALQEVTANVDESMGVRQVQFQPQFSPKASAKDVGRTPLKSFGQVEVNRIDADPKQPRSQFDEKDIQRLAASFRSNGQIQPIGVRWDVDAKRWVVVTGERRWRAAKATGLKTIDCYFHDDDITESEVLEKQLIENLQREDLKPLEEARGYAALMELNGCNGKQVAQALNVSPSRVSRALALLDLPDDVQQDVASGRIPKSSAYELTKLRDDDSQRTLGKQAAAGALTQKQTAGAVRQRRGKRTSKKQGVRQTFQAENGIKVTVTTRHEATYHEIEEALMQAIEEVRLRINNNIQLF